jgi:ZIP family zinc transporter
MAVVLAFGSVAMMYLVTEELLVEAHEIEEGLGKPLHSFLGFLIYLLISEAVGRHR